MTQTWGVIHILPIIAETLSNFAFDPRGPVVRRQTSTGSEQQESEDRGFDPHRGFVFVLWMDGCMYQEVYTMQECKVTDCFWLGGM